MSKAELAQNVFRSLLKELGATVTEETVEGVLTLKSEEWKFALNVHSDEGKFDKAVLEKPAEGGECCKKFEAVVDALTELLKSFSSCDKPEADAKPEEEANKTEEKAKEPEEEAKEPETKEEKSDENKENEAKEEQPSDA